MRVRLVTVALLALAGIAPAADARPPADAALVTAPMLETSARTTPSRSAWAIEAPVSFHFATREEGHEILLSDVHVVIEDTATRGRVLAIVSDGPYLQAHLAPGSYQVTATHAGRPRVEVIVVEDGEPLRIAFYW